MEFVRYDPQQARPLPGGVRATYMPVRSGDRLTAMLLHLTRDGDTGKREVPGDVLLVVISGEGRVRSGGQIAEVRPGDVCLLTGGIVHEIWTVDSELRAVLTTVS